MNREGKGGGYLEKEFFFAEEELNGDWKGTLYFEKGNIFFQRQRKLGKEARNIHRWRRKLCFLWRRRSLVEEKKENIW